MISKGFPILEFDRVSENTIEPSKFIKKIDMPEQVASSL